MVHNAQIHSPRTVLRNPKAYWTSSEDSAGPYGANGQTGCAINFRNAALKHPEQVLCAVRDDVGNRADHEYAKKRDQEVFRSRLLRLHA